jgi:hypothetical protein
MEWIKYPENKPSSTVIALVYNQKGWMHGSAKAVYHERYDCWVLCDPNYRESLTLEVSHYLPLPEPPKQTL